MPFTSWGDLRTSIKDALADHVAGNPCTGSYSIGNRSLTYRSFEELVDLLEKTYILESLESSGDRTQMVSYGRHGGFR